MNWTRRLLWSMGALLLLGAAAWLAVPPIVKWQAEQRLTSLLGRDVTIGAVSFHPWSLQLTVSDLAIGAAAGSASTEPQFRLAHLRVDADARSLLRLAPVIESLQIDAPRLRLTRTSEGHYDIDDILKRLASEPAKPPAEMPRFALYNVELRSGEVLFDDAPMGRKHRLSALTLTLPFLSNLSSQLDIKVEPRLAFTLNGAAYDSGGQALPFASRRSGSLTLRVPSLDLEPYLGYLPESLPVRLQHGHVGIDLALQFAAPVQGEASLSMRGKVSASDVRLTERGGAPLLTLGQVSLGLNEVQPLARKVALGQLSIGGLELHVSRDTGGVVSLQRLLPAPTPAAGAATAPAVPANAAWQFSLDTFELSGARVLWNDAAVKPASSWVIDGLALSARQLQLPSSAPMPFAIKATLRPQRDASATLAVLSLDGQATEMSATAHVELSALSLAAVAPYINAASHVQVAGTGAASGKFEWAAATPAQAQRILVSLDHATLDGLTADDPTADKPGHRGETLSVQRLQLDGVALDLASQAIAVASARLQSPRVLLERSTAGVWNLMRLAGPTPLAESERPLVRAAAEATWQFRLDDFALDDGLVRLVDAAPAPARLGATPQTVRLSIDKLRFGLQGLQLRGDRLASTPKVQLSARVADERKVDPAVKPGTIEWRGRLGMQPLLIAGKARIERFPVHAVQSYVPHGLGVRLRRADAGFQGDVSLQQADATGMRIDAAGDVLLSDLILDSRPIGAAATKTEDDAELLSWQSFAINGVNLALRPGAVPKLTVRNATLTDFFARLVLTEEGRLNFQDVEPAGNPASASVAASAAPAAAAASQAAPSSLPFELDLGGLQLVDGRVAYSDRFVRPNFSAALTELNGSVGAFLTGSGNPATLQLSGRVAGTGLLEITGKLNPGAVPRELDVTAKATDIELAPLSTYAGKYAGYAIERGKLSVDVHYKIDRDGKLDASHQVVLNQLTFGERVDSPTATKLPVLFAVSLLKDRNGVIDIDLPVSGTLNDPQFSVGPIIWKVILNLLAKAITAPFSLFAGGGGPDISIVAFQPGTSRPTEGGVSAIDKVAKALGDRPSLKMTVTGEADPDVEHDAYQRAVVEQRLAQQQRRELLRTSGAASAPESAAVPAGEERAQLIKSVYRETDLPDKPRNLIGMQSDIPTAEMEALLGKNVKVGPEAMRELALQRGLAVRDTLIAKGLASDRVFLGEPKLRVGDGRDANWSPQVKLTLDTK